MNCKFSFQSLRIFDQSLTSLDRRASHVYEACRKSMADYECIIVSKVHCY